MYKIWWTFFIHYPTLFSTTRCNGVILCTICIVTFKLIVLFISSENHSGLINIVSASADIFLLLRPGRIMVDPGYYCWILIYIEIVAIDSISKMQNIIYINIHGYVNSKALNVSSLIYTYND